MKTTVYVRMKYRLFFHLLYLRGRSIRWLYGGCMYLNLPPNHRNLTLVSCIIKKLEPYFTKAISSFTSQTIPFNKKCNKQDRGHSGHIRNYFFTLYFSLVSTAFCSHSNHAFVVQLLVKWYCLMVQNQDVNLFVMFMPLMHVRLEW